MKKQRVRHDWLSAGARRRVTTYSLQPTAYSLGSA